MKFVRYEEEHFFLDPSDPGRKWKFPDLSDEPTIDLTVVIPAKDEERRLPMMLDECLMYLSARTLKSPSWTYELIIVDDGSSDDTCQVALMYSLKYGMDRIRLLKLRHNRGKGGAVRLGVLCARGRQVLFADADGATRFADIELLERSLTEDLLDSPMAVVVGSRAQLENESIVKRSVFRTILMFGFHFLVWLFCVRTVRDTQCGFKLFTRSAARRLFPSLHMERWAFDVELLFIAEALKIPISEIPVNWQEVEGSKLSPLRASIEMGRDILLIWFNYATCFWPLDEASSSE